MSDNKNLLIKIFFTILLITINTIQVATTYSDFEKCYKGETGKVTCKKLDNYFIESRKERCDTFVVALTKAHTSGNPTNTAQIKFISFGDNYDEFVKFDLAKVEQIMPNDPSDVLLNMNSNYIYERISVPDNTMKDADIRFIAQFPDFNGEVTNNLHYVMTKFVELTSNPVYAVRQFQITFFADKDAATKAFNDYETGPFKRLKIVGSDPKDEEKILSTGTWKTSKLLKLFLYSDILLDKQTTTNNRI
jgi:hypothetical protein